MGNAAAFGSQLKGIGFPNVDTIELDNLDLTAANFQRPKRSNGRAEHEPSPAEPTLQTVAFRQPPSIAPDPGPNAQALLDKVITAKGGLATLRGLKTITAVTAETVQAPTGPLEAQTTTFLQYPDHVRIERKLSEGVGVQVFDGGHGWIKDPARIRPVSELAIRQMQTTLERDTVNALLAAHEGRLRARLLPDVKDDSGTVRHALELSANTVEPFVLYIDPATNLIDKEAYVSGEPGQPLVEEILLGLPAGGRCPNRILRLDAPRRAAPRHAPRHLVHDQHAARSLAVQTPRLLSLRILLSCGEPSGDLYAGALTRELRSLAPGIAISGLGGPQFAAAGGTLVEDYRGLAVTGLTEAIAKLPRSRAAIGRLAHRARVDRVDAIVLIDFPDFNFQLARRIKPLGIPIVYYISPQIWAWRAGRLKTMRAIADRVLVIFPFEEQMYRDGGVPVEFVGHPLVDLVSTSAPRDVFLRSIGRDPHAPTVAILPGSRVNEVRHTLADLAAAADIIAARIPGAQFVVARAPGLDDRLFDVLRRRPVANVSIVEGDTDTVLAASDVALTASGTATVQTALHDVPMVIVYRLSALTFRIVRRLVKVDAIGMVNLIAGERIVPELIQDQFTPEAVAAEAVSMLTDRARAAAIRAGLARVRERLGGSGASRRAAEAIVQVAAARQATSA